MIPVKSDEFFPCTKTYCRGKELALLEMLLNHKFPTSLLSQSQFQTTFPTVSGEECWELRNRNIWNILDSLVY